MNPDKTKKRCKGCKQLVDASEYGTNTKGRIRRLCNSCVNQRIAADDLPKWDWANAVNKATSMHAVHDKLHPAVYTDMITPEVLRIIMEDQRGRCMITNRKLYLPSEDALGINETLVAWRDNLPEHLADMTPVLVRVDATRPWEPGNIFFIVKFWQHVYEMCNNYPEFRDMLNTILKGDAPLKILDSITITKRLGERTRARLEARRLRNIQ